MPVVGDTVAYHGGLSHKMKHPRCPHPNWGMCDQAWRDLVDEMNYDLDATKRLKDEAERSRQDRAYAGFMASEARRVAAYLDEGS